MNRDTSVPGVLVTSVTCKYGLISQEKNCFIELATEETFLLKKLVRKLGWTSLMLFLLLRNLLIRSVFFHSLASRRKQQLSLNF